MFLKIQEICLKFQLKMAEIIEVKVGNPHLDFFILLLHHGRKMLQVLILSSFIEAISAWNFKILVAIM